MTRSLKEEFTGLTNNQAYERGFNHRLMRPDPNTPGRYLGNTQREDFLRYLSPILMELPEPAEIFDFGAGAGEIIDLALHTVPSATINLEEPSHLLLDKYKERIRKSANLTLGICYNGPLQDYYNNMVSTTERPQAQQDLALAIHMIYHLTPFKEVEIDPSKDIQQAVGTMYSFLKPGGILFIVFANQLISIMGQAGRYYFQKKDDLKTAQNLKNIYESRDRLLRQGLIASHLNTDFPGSKAVVTSVPTNSCIYGFSREDITAMCLSAELGEANDSPFDIEKLEIIAEFIDGHEKEIGLTIEDRDVPQKNMLRANQPQIITMIRRESL